MDYNVHIGCHIYKIHVLKKWTAMFVQGLYKIIHIEAW
jgi:hypothetical protein